MAILFELPFGRLPPFLPIIADDVWHQRLLDLIDGRFAAKAVEDDFNQLQMVRCRQLPQSLKIGRFSGQNVIAWNRPERFGRKRKIHRMAGLVLKIDRKSRKHRIY